jgi:E3 ubiquitin-protein ligase UBR4
MFEDEMTFDIDEIIANEREKSDNEDTENVAEDSDEDANKLCTFTITQKDFMNQHWYW